MASDGAEICSSGLSFAGDRGQAIPAGQGKGKLHVPFLIGTVPAPILA